MPSSQRSRGKWWFEKSEDDKIQVLTSTGKIKHSGKSLENVLSIKEKPNTDKVKIYFETDENQSYSKSINVFDFTVNAVSGQFRNFLTSSEVFCKRFSDIYGKASLSDQDAEQLSNNEAEIVAIDSQENELSSSCTAKTPVRKSNPTINKRSSQASPTVETAQQTPPKKKKKRSGSNSDSDRENQSDEAFLIEIQKYLAPGIHKVAVTSLRQPRDDYLLRPINKDYVKALKQTLVETPMVSFKPLVVVIKDLKNVEEFDASSLDQYQFEVLGGNHRRVALMELIAEQQDAGQSCYSHVHVQIYSGILKNRIFFICLFGILEEWERILICLCLFLTQLKFGLKGVTMF